MYGISCYRNQKRIVFLFLEFFQCAAVVVTVYAVRHGCDAASSETTGVNDKFQMFFFHGQIFWRFKILFAADTAFGLSCRCHALFLGDQWKPDDLSSLRLLSSGILLKKTCRRLS